MQQQMQNLKEALDYLNRETDGAHDEKQGKTSVGSLCFRRTYRSLILNQIPFM